MRFPIGFYCEFSEFWNHDVSFGVFARGSYPMVFLVLNKVFGFERASSNRGYIQTSFINPLVPRVVVEKPQFSGEFFSPLNLAMLKL